jgi:ABC-2 type transport system ATP-binding protein
MTELAVHVENLLKTYGKIPAVSDISFSIREGELFGLIGPDGAGKTTTMRILCGLLSFNSGQCKVLSYDVQSQIKEIKKIIGYMPQRFSLYPDLTVSENLRFFADLFQVTPRDREERLNRLLKFSNLEPFQKRRADQLSGGMKQKLALSCTLIHTPKLLILDEPTTGVDPISRREFWEILYELKQEGVTILVSTPYMDEANKCDSVAMMHRGKILAIDSPENISDLFSCHLLEIITDELINTSNQLKELAEVKSVQIFGDKIHVTTEKIDQAILEIRTKIPNVASIRKIEPSIEDTFIELMR